MSSCISYGLRNSKKILLYKHNTKYKEGNNRPSSVTLKSVVHKHEQAINATLRTTRTLGKTQVCEYICARDDVATYPPWNQEYNQSKTAKGEYCVIVKDNCINHNTFNYSRSTLINELLSE